MKIQEEESSSKNTFLPREKKQSAWKENEPET